MGKANALSRHTDHKEVVEHDNENVTLLKPEYFKVCMLSQGHLLIKGKQNLLLSKIQKSRDLNESVVKAVESHLLNIYNLKNGLKNKNLYYTKTKFMYQKTINLE